MTADSIPASVAVNIERLRRFLKPRHVAVIGGRWCDEVVRQCRRIGFAGDIWPVNAKRATLGGIPCRATLSDLPAAPDAVFVGVNHTATIDVVGALGAMGAGGAVCFASGFSEVGDVGWTRQQALVRAAGDMPVQGPNCYGLLNYLDGVALWPDQHGGEPVDSGVAILSQSGNVAISLTMQQRGLPLAYMISLGNQAQTGVPQFIEAMLDDDRIRAIGILIEGLNDVAAFSVAAIRALEKRVPIVAIKSGRSEAGARITLSHTHTLAGSDALYDALFARYGVIRVETLPAFVETLKLLALAGPLAGNRLVSMSCSGGEASLLADLAENRALALPDFSASERAVIRPTVHDLVHVSNPFDYHTFDWANRNALRRTFSAVAAADYDARLLVCDWPAPERCDPAAWDTSIAAYVDAVADAKGPSMVVSTLHENIPAPVRDRLVARGVVPMYGLDEALGAIEAAAWIGQCHRTVAASGLPLPLRPAVPLATGPGHTIDEVASKRRLAAYGVPVPDGRLTDADGAVAAAAALGVPVVVKAVAAHLAHKSDVGGVALDLTDGDAVRGAVAAMADLSAQFLVERMETGVLAEMIVGLSHDAQFGTVLVIGAGGLLVELVQDSQALLFPVSRGDVGDALNRLKLARLLDGYRGKPAADREAIVDAVMAVAAFAEAHMGTLVELDINPLLVLEDRVVAVDALLRTTGTVAHGTTDG